MKLTTRRLVRGALIAKKILGAGKVYIGIEDNKPDAIELMKEKVDGIDNI